NTGSTYTAAQGLQALVFQNVPWVLGGYGNSGLLVNLYEGACVTAPTWTPTNTPITPTPTCCPDGSTWNAVSASPVYTARELFAAVTFNNNIWVIGGEGNSGSLFNDVWSTTSGNANTWSQVTSSAQFSARLGHTAVVMPDPTNGGQSTMWVIAGGSTSGIVNDVWKSTNGSTWTEVTANAPFAAREYHTCLV